MTTPVGAAGWRRPRLAADRPAPPRPAPRPQAAGPPAPAREHTPPPTGTGPPPPPARSAAEPTVRRHPARPAAPRTADQIKVGRWSLADASGALLALVVYGPVLAYVKGGPDLARQWWRAKFLNDVGGEQPPPWRPLRPGDPGIPESYTPAPTDPETPGPWRGGADNPPPWMPQPGTPPQPGVPVVSV